MNPDDKATLEHGKYSALPDDIAKLLARKIFTVLSEQNPGDIAELRELAAKARQRGYTQLALDAEEIARQFEMEDATK